MIIMQDEMNDVCKMYVTGMSEMLRWVGISEDQEFWGIEKLQL